MVRAWSVTRKVNCTKSEIVGEQSLAQVCCVGGYEFSSASQTVCNDAAALYRDIPTSYITELSKIRWADSTGENSG